MIYRITIGFGTELGARLRLDTRTKELTHLEVLNEACTRIILGQFSLTYQGLINCMRWYYNIQDNLSDTACLNQLAQQKIASPIGLLAG